VDVEHNFKPEYVVPDKAKKVIDDLKKESKNATAIYLATDPDREGRLFRGTCMSYLNNVPGPKIRKDFE
jgi:DNA topoisomerase IA